MVSLSSCIQKEAKLGAKINMNHETMATVGETFVLP